MSSNHSTPLLKVENLQAGYGQTQILKGIDLEVCAGEIVVVVGPNGAGKTTLLSSVSNITTRHEGRILFKGRDITSLRPDRIARLGLSHCPEGRKIFTRLTVEENLIAGFIARDGVFYEKLRDDVFELFPILRERRHNPAGLMSGGQQQMLAIGRSLMASPELIMLDEPSLGLAPKLIRQIFQIIIELANRGIAILLVEQNVRLALEVGDYAYLLELGRSRIEGGAAKLAQDPDLVKMYLGGEKNSISDERAY